MKFSASDFFNYRLDYLEHCVDGLQIMEVWIECETSWRRSLLELIRKEALTRLSSDMRSRHLALQALVFVGNQDDLEQLSASNDEYDALLADSIELARAELQYELATDQDLAREVCDGPSFQRFLRVIVRRRSRVDELITHIPHPWARVDPDKMTSLWHSWQSGKSRRLPQGARHGCHDAL